jgi:Na+/alanine symporter
VKPLLSQHGLELDTPIISAVNDAGYIIIITIFINESKQQTIKEETLIPTATTSTNQFKPVLHAFELVIIRFFHITTILRLFFLLSTNATTWISHSKVIQTFKLTILAENSTKPNRHRQDPPASAILHRF